VIIRYRRYCCKGLVFSNYLSLAENSGRQSGKKVDGISHVGDWVTKFSDEAKFVCGKKGRRT